MSPNEKNEDILFAIRRPEYKTHNFKPEDYELQDGLPVRKDRFENVCRSLVNAFYHGRTWSAAALKRHVVAFQQWFNSFQRDYEGSAYPRFESIYKSDLEFKVSIENYVESFCVAQNNVILVRKQISDEELEKIKKTAVDDSECVDAILDDGSVLSRCQLVSAVIKLPAKNETSDAEIVIKPSIIWNGMDVSIKVVSVRTLSEEELHKMPFWLRFEPARLTADLEVQLAHEDNLRKNAEPEMPTFEVS